jgi:hypothetical protein
VEYLLVITLQTQAESTMSCKGTLNRLNLTKFRSLMIAGSTEGAPAVDGHIILKVSQVLISELGQSLSFLHAIKSGAKIAVKGWFRFKPN